MEKNKEREIRYEKKRKYSKTIQKCNKYDRTKKNRQLRLIQDKDIEARINIQGGKIQKVSQQEEELSEQQYEG